MTSTIDLSVESSHSLGVSAQRTVLLTGSSSGIGSATCELLLERGHQVIGIARRRQRALTNFFPVQADLSKLDAIDDLVRTVVEHHPVDAVIANAGAPLFGGLEEASASMIQASLSLNLLSPILLIRALIPTLRRRTQSHVILIGSESALRGGARGSVYCAAKFGLRGFSQALRQEAAAQGVCVSLVNPGMVDTPFFDQQSFRPGPEDCHALRAKDVAETVVHILESPARMVFDEVHISPRKHVIDFSKKKELP